MSFLVVLKGAKKVHTFDEGVEIVVDERWYTPSEFGSGCMFYDRWVKEGEIIGFRIYLEMRVQRDQILFWRDLCQHWHGELNVSDGTVDLFFQAENETRSLEVTQEFGEVVLKCKDSDMCGVAFYLLDEMN